MPPPPLWATHHTVSMWIWPVVYVLSQTDQMLITSVPSAILIMTFRDPISPGYPRKKEEEKALTLSKHLLCTRHCVGYILWMTFLGQYLRLLVIWPLPTSPPHVLLFPSELWVTCSSWTHDSMSLCILPSLPMRKEDFSLTAALAWEISNWILHFTTNN